jgi:hypothetical protein
VAAKKEAGETVAAKKRSPMPNHANSGSLCALSRAPSALPPRSNQEDPAVEAPTVSPTTPQVDSDSDSMAGSDSSASTETKPLRETGGFTLGKSAEPANALETEGVRTAFPDVAAQAAESYFGRDASFEIALSNSARREPQARRQGQGQHAPRAVAVLTEACSGSDSPAVPAQANVYALSALPGRRHWWVPLFFK